MRISATHKPTLAAELFGGGVGFRWQTFVRRSCGTLLIGSALLFLLRRADGALDEPPSFATALLVMAAVSAVAAGYRLSPPSDPRPDVDMSLPGRMQLQLAYGTFAASLLPPAAAIGVAAALSIAGIGGAALSVLWGSVVANEIAWVFIRRAATLAEIETALARKPASPTVDRAERQVPDLPLADSAEDVGLTDNDGLSQSWRRFFDASGSDVYEGRVRVSFETGSRQAAVHVAFCPPFENLPTLTSESLDELELKLVHAVVLPYGARIDVRLSEPAEAGLTTTIGIRAVARRA